MEERSLKKKYSINNLWDNNKWFYIYIIRFLGKDIFSEIKNRMEEVFEEIIVKMF